VAGTCECGNVLSGSIKCGEFLDLEYVGKLASTANFRSDIHKCQISMRIVHVTLEHDTNC
jgi:hypothetical protein